MILLPQVVHQLVAAEEIVSKEVVGQLLLLVVQLVDQVQEGGSTGSHHLCVLLIQRPNTFPLIEVEGHNISRGCGQDPSLEPKPNWLVADRLFEPTLAKVFYH